MRRLPLLAVACAAWAAAAQAVPSDSILVLALVGDIMLGRGVKRITDTAGLFYPYSPTCSLLRSADLAIGNLESPLTTAGYRTPSPWKFKGDTAAAALELRRSGFRLLALANNHAPDCGEEGFYETCRSLDRAGILYGGMGDSFRLAEPWPAGFDTGRHYPYSLPAFTTVRGIRIGFLSFCQPYLLEISKDYGGQMIARADSATVVNSVRLARQCCDLVVCSFHWGQEYQDRPNREQRKLGRLAVDAGAGIVHGHHPHVLQGVEFYHGGLIAYSLGNFIFDQRHVKPRQSAVLVVRLREKALFSAGFGAAGDAATRLEIDSVHIHPLEIVKNRPQPASDKGWKAMTERLRDLCRRLGTAAVADGRRLRLLPSQAGRGKEKRPG